MRIAVRNKAAAKFEKTDSDYIREVLLQSLDQMEYTVNKFSDIGAA